MKDLGVSQAEARAQAEQARADEEETPRHVALEWCRLLVGRYAGADELADLTVVDAGPCMDCHRIVDARYQIGAFAVCRDDAVQRIRAGKQLAQPIPTLYDQAAPADLYGWMHANAGRYTERALRVAFKRWAVDGDTQIELLDLNHDLAQSTAKELAAA